MSEFKMLTFPCNFQGGAMQEINFYVGFPALDSHPLAFQAKWLGEKGGQIPPAVHSAIGRIKEIAKKHNITFISLCEYVLASM